MDGVTDILYTYDSEYPRLATKSVGTGRTMTRIWYRGMWVESDTYAESSGLESVNAFGDWDVYGQPGYAEATDHWGGLANPVRRPRAALS